MSSNQNFRCILITGKPGIGKTTSVRKIVDNIRSTTSAVGFYTEEVRDRLGARIGFDVVRLDGKREVLARIDGNKNLPKVGKYSVYVENFENLVLPLFNDIEADLLIVDEIGKMELYSQKFTKKISEALKQSCDRKPYVLATVPQNEDIIRKSLNIQYSDAWHLATVTRANRDRQTNEITQKIHEMFKKFLV